MSRMHDGPRIGRGLKIKSSRSSYGGHFAEFHLPAAVGCGRFIGYTTMRRSTLN